MLSFIPFALTFAVVYSATWACIFTPTVDVLDGAYRHQADTYRAVQLLTQSGFPRDHILFMNPDSVLFDEDNPTYGYLFTEPGCDARDVTYRIYPNYTEPYVNVTNFKSILGFRHPENNTMITYDFAPNDTLIYYIVGHGSTGTIFCKDEYIFYDDIINAMDKFLLTHNYLHIYYFVDTCKAGSLFNHTSFSEYVHLQRFNSTYSHDINVMTATDDTHNSYPMNCNGDVLKIFYLNNFCITDEFSKHWMDAIQFGNENTTMFDLYNYTQAHTVQSPVTTYGRWEDSAWNRPVWDAFNITGYVENMDDSAFIYSLCGLTQTDSRRLKSISADKKAKNKKRFDVLNKYMKTHPEFLDNFEDELTLLKNYELRSKALSGKDKTKYTLLYNEEKKRVSSIRAWESAIRKKYPHVVFEDNGVRDWSCFRRLVNEFDAHFGHSRFGMNRFYYLSTLCDLNSTIEMEW